MTDLLVNVMVEIVSQRPIGASMGQFQQRHRGRHHVVNETQLLGDGFFGHFHQNIAIAPMPAKLVIAPTFCPVIAFFALEASSPAPYCACSAPSKLAPGVVCCCGRLNARGARGAAAATQAVPEPQAAGAANVPGTACGWAGHLTSQPPGISLWQTKQSIQQTTRCPQHSAEQ